MSAWLATLLDLPDDSLESFESALLYEYDGPSDPPDVPAARAEAEQMIGRRADGHPFALGCDTGHHSLYTDVAFLRMSGDHVARSSHKHHISTRLSDAAELPAPVDDAIAFEETFGLGAALYFRALKVLAGGFALMLALATPSLVGYSQGGAIAESSFTELSAVSLGNLPDTGANATEPELKWGALGQAALTDIFTWLDALATCVLLAVAVFLIARQSACVEEADVRSTTITDYTVWARGLPPHARAPQLRKHFERAAARALAAQRGGDEERVDPSIAEIWIHFGCAEALRAAARVKALDAEVAHLVRQITRDVDALGLQKLAASADGAERGLLGGSGGRAIGAAALRAAIARSDAHSAASLAEPEIASDTLSAPQPRWRRAMLRRRVVRATRRLCAARDERSVHQTAVDAQAERVAQLRRDETSGDNTCATRLDAPRAVACFVTFHDARAAHALATHHARLVSRTLRHVPAPLRVAAARLVGADGDVYEDADDAPDGGSGGPTEVLPHVSRAPEPAEVRWENLELSDLRRAALAARTAVVVLTVLSAAGLACFLLLKEQRDIIEAAGGASGDGLSVTQQLAANVQSGAYAAVIAAVGVVERKLLLGLVELEGHASIEREQRDLVTKTTLVLSINAGVLLTLANIDEHGAEFGATWYASVGNAIVLSLCASALAMPASSAGDALLARLCAHWQTAPGCALSHADAVTAWIGPGFHLSERVAQLAMTLLVASAYSSGMPIVYAVVLATIGAHYASGKYVALRCCPRGSVARHGAAALQQLADCLLIAAVVHCVVGIWALSCHELEEDGHEVFDLAHVRGKLLDPHVLPLTGVLLVAGPLVMLYFLGLFDVVRDTVEHAGVALFARHEGWLAEQFSIKRFEANPRFEEVAEGLERYTAAERFHVEACSFYKRRFAAAARALTISREHHYKAAADEECDESPRPLPPSPPPPMLSPPPIPLPSSPSAPRAAGPAPNPPPSPTETETFDELGDSGGEES